MARLFNGSSDVITTSSVPTTVRDTLTMSVWVWQVTNPGTQIVMYNGNTGGNGWGFYSNASNLFFLVGGIGQSTYTLPSAAAWHHLAAVNTGALGHANWVIYIDGVAQSPFNPSDLTVPTGSLTFGANGGSNFNNCQLADGAIWTTILTAGEIAALAAGARPGTIRPQLLAGWWPLDGLASPEPDFSGFANNGALTGTTFAPGPPLMMFTPRWPQFSAAAAVLASPFINLWDIPTRSQRGNVELLGGSRGTPSNFITPTGTPPKAQYDWPVPNRVRHSLFPRELGGTTIYFPSTVRPPIALYDWPVPMAPARGAIDLRWAGQGTPVTLFPTPSVQPFNQYAWPVPQAYLSSVGLKTWSQSIALTLNPTGTLMGAMWM